MNTTKLQYLVEVAKTGSISAAAINLFVTQPAISQVISQLEKEVDHVIFNRTKDGLVPTVVGQKIISKAIEILEKVQELNYIKENVYQMGGELRIGAIPGVMPNLVRTIKIFKKESPYIDVYLTEETNQNILQWIKENKIDIGIIPFKENAIYEMKGLIFNEVTEGQLVAIANQHSSYAQKDFITPDEMKELPFIYFEDDFINEFYNDFNKIHGDLNVLFKTNNSDAVRQALLEDLGVSVAHSYSLVNDENILNKRLKILKLKNYEQVSVKLCWVYSYDFKLSIEVEKFIDLYNMTYGGTTLN